MELKDQLLKRVNELLETKEKKSLGLEVAEMDATITHLYEILYGRQSTKYEIVSTLRKQAYSAEQDKRFNYDTNRHSKLLDFRQGLFGCLTSLKAEIEIGLLANIQAEAQGEVYSDLVASAYKALDEGRTIIAAVLACASLENALKQCAIDKFNLDVEEADMSQVIGALKSKGAIPKRQGDFLDTIRNFRNDTFHARWKKIDSPEIRGVLGFTEEFLNKHFSGNVI